MYTINYVATNQLLRGSPWYPVSGSVAIYRAAFEFSPDWDGFVKTAVFRSREATREQLLDSDDSCIVPWEPLQEPGWLEVGVYGVSGTTRLPTYWAAPVPIGDAPGRSDPAQEPSPDKWQQYIDQVKDTVPAAVEEYLDENPVTVTEIDPTVPAWAKAPEKPAYTAQEVGALPEDTEIPTVPTKVSAFANDAGYLTEHQSLEAYAKKADIPTQLPNPEPLTIHRTGGSILYTGVEPYDLVIADRQPCPYSLTFTGAATGSYDGSEVKTVNIPTVPASLKNPKALTFTGAASGSYDGSEAVTINIPSGGGGGSTPDQFIGATATEAGESGLVPAPAAGNNTQFLRGDGSWATAVPSSTSSDAGKFLRVGEDGSAAWETVANAEEASF